MPLLHAVHHGCRAGRHDEVNRSVFRPRVYRGYDNFVVHKLGAVSSQLAALSSFFTTPTERLGSRSRVFLLNEIGYDLWIVGRVDEGVKRIREALDLDLASDDLKSAAWTCRTLARLLLATGDVQAALDIAEQAVTLADLSGDDYERLTNRAYHGAMLHLRGCIDEGRRCFEESEKILVQSDLQQPGPETEAAQCSPPELILREGAVQCPFLWGVAAAYYCTLLVHLGRADAVPRRVAGTAEMVAKINRLLDFGLDHLSLGRARHELGAKAAAAGNKGQAKKLQTSALRHFTEAIVRFRRGRWQDYLSQCLVARAAFLRDFGNRDEAYRDLREALDLSSRIGLRLHETDARLLEGHLALDLDPPDVKTATDSLKRADTLVQETGYHLRDADLLILEGRLLAKQGDKEAGRARLEEAIHVAKREEKDGCVYQVAVDQAERYLREMGVGV